MRAVVVVDLGFGDAGKGLLTDFLVRHTAARLVVRYNGGAQAGHNVVLADGRHHTFSQFGSGTLVPGVKTFLSANVVIHPTALFEEERRLCSIGVDDALQRTRISEAALVVTPYHQAAGRLRELARRSARHGSCGVGVGETVGHALRAPGDAIRAADLRDRPGLRRKLARIREHEWTEVAALPLGASEELAIFERPDIDDRWIAAAAQAGELVTDDSTWPDLAEGAPVVFEGAHGVLIDERHGFAPHTTWSPCTAAPAHELLAEFAPGADVRTVGALRCYAVRHGPGPFPTESAEVTDTPPDHNTSNPWQGRVRRGWFDSVLARYAIRVGGAIDVLAITHLDWLSKLVRWSYCDAYRLGVPSPVLRHCAASESSVLGRIEQSLGRPVAIGSRGPTAADVFIRHEFLWR